MWILVGIVLYLFIGLVIGEYFSKREEVISQIESRFGIFEFDTAMVLLKIIVAVIWLPAILISFFPHEETK